MKRIQLEIKNGCFRNPFAPPDALPPSVFFSEEMFVFAVGDDLKTKKDALTCDRIVKIKKPLKPGELIHFFGQTTISKESREEVHTHKHDIYAIIIEVSDTALTLELIDYPKRYLRQTQG